jgi:hypothetical protein
MFNDDFELENPSDEVLETLRTVKDATKDSDDLVGLVMLHGYTMSLMVRRQFELLARIEELEARLNSQGS